MRADVHVRADEESVGSDGIMRQVAGYLRLGNGKPHAILARAETNRCLALSRQTQVSSTLTQGGPGDVID